jgi:hypothetical protein
MHDPEFEKLVAALKAQRRPRHSPTAAIPKLGVAIRRTSLAPDAPAPHLEGLVAKRGQQPTAEALSAWNDRVGGAPIIDVAHNLGVSIELAKVLIKEVHQAIGEDLKANLEVNRTLDLARVDGLIRAHYPIATAGDEKSANVVLRALQHRARLTGAEPQPERTTQAPENVLIWIQQQLPSINRLVDALPQE